jgi:hypothetical protein
VVRRDEARGLGSLAPTRFKPWKRVTGVLDSMPVVGDLWRAANAWCRQGSRAGNRWVQATRTAMLRGRVGAVIGGRRQILTQRTLRQSVRETRTTVSRCLHHHRCWMTSDQDLAMGWPVETGGVESACGAVVKHRMEGAGTRWSLAGAEAMLALRALQKSHDHARRASWRFQARQAWARLDARTPQYTPTTRLTRGASRNSTRSHSSRFDSCAT